MLVSTFCIIALCISNLIAAASPEAMQQPGLAQEQQGQEVPPPSEEEIRQMEEALAQMTPEEQEELEKLGRDLINNMSDDELKELADMFGTTPEELRREAQEPIQPAQKPEPQPEKDKQPEPQPQKTEQFMQEREVRRIITQTIDVLSKIIQKAEQIPERRNALASVMQEMQDIVTYLKIIREKEQIKRLTGTEYKEMMSTLQSMLPQLQQQESRIITPEEETRVPYDAYERLGVSRDASQQEIQQAYQRLKEQYAPENVRKRLEQDGVTPRQKKYALRDAETEFAKIQSAYEALKDPHKLAQQRREEQALQRQQQQAENASQEAQKTIVNIITHIVYQEKLIQHLEAFLKAYEPQALKKKQEQERAEEQRKKEAKERERQRPEQAQTRGLEPRIQPPKPQREPQMRQPGQAQQQPDKAGQPSQKKPQEEDKKQTGAAGPPDKQKKEQPTSEKTDKTKQQKQPEKRKEEQQREASLLSSIQSDIDEVRKAYNACKQTFDQIRNIQQTLPDSPSTSLTSQQAQTLDTLTSQLQQCMQQAPLDTLKRHIDNAASAITGLTQQQKSSWQQTISSALKAIQPIDEALSQAYGALSRYSETSGVENLYKEVKQDYERVHPIYTRLSTYNDIAQSSQSFTAMYTQALNNTANAIAMIEKTADNISQMADQFAKGTLSESELTKAWQTIHNNMDEDQLETLMRLTYVLKNAGELPQDQHATWQSAISSDKIERVRKAAENIQSAYETLTKQLSQDKQQRLQDTLTQMERTYSMLSPVAETSKAINEDIQKAGQKAQQTAQAGTAAAAA